MKKSRRKSASPRLRKPRTESLAETPGGTSTMRLQKFLAQAGFGSRRGCEKIVLSGRVTVDGERVDELGITVNPATQKICLDDTPVRLERKRYFLLNKPAGYLCTHRDPEGRPLAVDLVPTDRERLFTVGRLDENSRGLLLVTNDGDLANRLAHPRYQVERRYEVQVAGRPTAETLASLMDGLYFSDGHFRIRGFRRQRVLKNSTYLEVVLTEGRNREIRRLFARVGHKVLNLTRIGFGPLSLGRIKEGDFRELKESELAALRELVVGRRKNSGKRTDEKTDASKDITRKSRTSKTVASQPAQSKKPAGKFHKGKSERGKEERQRESKAGKRGAGRSATPKPRVRSTTRRKR